MVLRRLASIFTLLLISVSLLAQKQEKTDSLVRLLGCDELQQVEQYGISFRRALGHARFKHNSTLLVCDTAIWNVNTNVINAFGNVRIIQNETVLSSDKLDYKIDDNLAQFRGALVQLQDKQKNTLRTKNLDYNTKDSVAIFRGGAAMKDKDGQVIESDYGSYDSQLKLFVFKGQVNMYTDSIFVSTNSLNYNTNTNVAVFSTNTNVWKGNDMLSAEAGIYDRNTETFLFHEKVHLMTPTQEAWSDSLRYFKIPNNVEMFGNVELLDTTREVSAVAGYMYFNDSLSLITMKRDPAVIAVSEQDGQRDTTYIGADTLLYYAVRKCDIPESDLKVAATRLEEVNADAITAYRQNAANAARAAAEEAKRKAAESDPNAAGAADRGQRGNSATKGAGAGTPKSGGAPANVSGKKKADSGRTPDRLPAALEEFPDLVPPAYSFAPQEPDTLKRHAPKDTTGVPALKDSLKVGNASDSLKVSDTTSVVKDTTKIGYLFGKKNVRVFRKDMQVSCDSLAYNDLDSLIRLYESPLIWNELNRQYTADSIRVIVKNRSIERASLMSDAFIIIQEDSICYDQIKGAEMMAFFDSTGVLTRFDAMGGASGVFYIEEGGVFATVNKFEAKMFTATFVDGEINDLNYFEDAKTNAYPVVQLRKDEKVLKGFEWQPDKRPKGPEDITHYVPRKSQREHYEVIDQPSFVQTDIYFPGYMASVHKMLAQQDSLKQARRIERKRMEKLREEREAMVADSLKAAQADSPNAMDSKKEADGEDAGESKVGSKNKDSKNKDSKPKTQTSENSGEDEGDPLGEGPSEDGDKGDLGEEDLDLTLPFGKTAKDLEKERLKEEKMKARAEIQARKDSIRAEKEAVREAKWAALDAKDAEKAAVKAQKELKKKRASTLKAVIARDEREAREQKYFDRYVAKYEKKKARMERRKAARSGGKKNTNQSDIQVDHD